jgi:hypothetical protein
MSTPLKQKTKAPSNKDASLIKKTEISWLTKEKERKWIKEVRKERKRREERKRRCKAEIQRTTMMPMPLKQKSEAAVLVSSNKDVTTLINKTEIALSMKAIKSKVKSTNVRDRDLNFDRDNPSLSNVLSFNVLLSDRTPKALLSDRTPKTIKSNMGISTQSNNISSVSYNLLSDRTLKTIKSNMGILSQSNRIPSVSDNLLSDRTPKAIKLPPSSWERVMNYDANFDRDNPSPSNVLSPSLESKSLPFNLLLVLERVLVPERAANNIKSPPCLGFLLSNTLLVPERYASSTKLPSSNKASPLSNINSNNIIIKG